MKQCSHHSCRSARAAELAAMAERLNRPDLLAEAVELHQQGRDVRCRQVSDEPERPQYARIDVDESAEIRKIRIK